MKKGVSLLVIFFLSVAVAGCNWAPETLNGVEAAEEGQALNMVENTEPVNLDTAKYIDESSAKIITNVMEGLMRLDADNRPQPAIAADFPEISPDRKTYVFNLREAYWSDGEPVTAYDFEYAWKRALDPKTKNKYAYVFYPILNAEEYHTGKAKAESVGVQAIDENTLKVRLKSPTPYFLSLLSFISYMPQRQDVVEKYGDQYAKDADKMVYNGPFVLSKWEHEQGYQLTKNEEYWDKDNVRLSRVNVKIVPQSDKAIRLYMSDLVDVVPLRNKLVDVFQPSKEFVSAISSTVYYLRFNVKNDFLSNRHIRQAITLALDREELTQDVLKFGTPAYAMVPPTIHGYVGYFRDQADRKQGKLVYYDVNTAKEALQKGIAELGIDKVPPLKLLVYDDDRKIVALYVQEQLEKYLGIPVEISVEPAKEKAELEMSGKFDMSIFRWTADYDDPMTILDLWETKNGLNFGHWSNYSYDQIIERSKDMSDYRQRNENLIEAEKLLLQDYAAAPLYYENNVFFMQKSYVKNLVHHPIGAAYSLKWVEIRKK
ncbi:peptide ABC transporter substrate-binding protein [Polycladomyces subterraneus]|uniref:Peptide ABC transporter substrate-binding protein n=1 Tax=Polycladomyces subterraneus TaxID=1016997 RepID=A0ABT8IJS1_9BACL|nr:peptide ABC transporter substrate-binding protein [Polycladomyces subterraneus]MDN4593006.1 peptide ABC transporter substrate-binding protein [Polycladomyces subterraneus]